MSDAPRHPRRRRLVTFVLALAVFASGIVVGAAGATAFIARRAQQAIQQPELQAERIADRLRRRLDLRDDQAAEVRAILARRQAALLRIRADVQPRVRAELVGVREEVAGVLDAPQRAQWDALYEDFSARWLPATRPTTGEAR